MSSLIKGRLGREQGNSLVEFAVIVPVLLLMCFGTMDFSRLMYSGIAVANAARAGVQYGAFSPGNDGDTTGMQNAALADAANQGLTGVTATARNFCGCTDSTNEISCTATCTGGTTPDGYVEVTVNYTFSTLMAMTGIPQTMPLTKTARMRVQ